MESLLTQITNYLLAQSWQIAVLTIVIVFTTFLLRNKSAHVRYLLWMIVLAKCIIPPFYTVPLAVLPQQEISVQPTAQPINEAMITEYSVPEIAATEFPEPEPDLPEVMSSPVPIEKKVSYNNRMLLSIGWLAGVLILSLYYIINALRTQIWLYKQRKKLPSEYRKNIESLLLTHGVKKMPHLWVLDKVSQPFVWGLVQGSIYLPAEMINEKQLKFHTSLIGHELSHIIRLDALINSLQIIAQIIFWFHPFVWWTNKKIRIEREKCCDETTIARLNALPEDYSNAIVEILAAKYERARRIPSLAVAGKVKNIEERIKTMLRPEKKFYKRPTVTTIIVLILAALVSIPIGCVLTRRTEKIQVPVVKDFYTGLQRPDGIVCLDKDNLIVVQEAYGPGIGIIKCRRDDTFSTDDVFSGFGSPYNNPDGLIQLPDGRFIVTDGQANTIFEVPKEGGPPRVFLSGITSYTNPAVAPSDFDGPNVDPGDLLIPQWSPASIIAVNPITKEKKNFVDHSFFSPFCEQGVGALEFGPDNKLYMSWSNNPEDKKPPRIYRFDSNGNGEIFLELKDYAYNISDFKIEIDKKNSWLYYVHDPIQPSPYSGQGTIFRISLDKSTNELVCDLGLPCQNIELSPDGKNLYIGIVGISNVIKEIQNVHLLPKHELKEDAPAILDTSPTSKLDDPASWTPQVNGCLIEQTGSKIHIVGTTNIAGWRHENAITSTKVLPEGDFYACVDFMVPMFRGSGNKLVHLYAKSTTDNDKMVGILFQPNVGTYNIQGRGESGNLFGGTLGGFGDEDKEYHRMKLKYDSATKTAYGWIDDKFIGSLDYTMTGPVKFELHANTQAKGSQIDLFFDNLSISTDISEAPPIPTGEGDSISSDSGEKPSLTIPDTSPEPKLDNPEDWVPQIYGCLIEQTGSKIHIVGTTNMEGWGHNNGIATTKVLPEGDFYACVDFMVPRFSGPGNTLVYLRATSTTDNGGLVAILFQPNGGYRIQGWGENGNIFGGMLRNFGDEDKAYHRMKLKYDAVAKTAFGWVDDKSIGYLNYPMTGPVKFELLANTETKGMQIDLFFDNLSISSDISEAPPIPASESLLVAVTSGDIEQVKSLFSKETDPNARNAALQEACSVGELEIVKLMIENGADINAKNSRGDTPLHLAARSGQKDISELLIDKGADINAKHNQGGTPLASAVDGGHRDVAELLLDNGADVNVKGNTGRSILYFACQRGNKEIAELLIDNGADVNAKNNAGQTLLDLAQSAGHTEIVELLKEHGAK